MELFQVILRHFEIFGASWSSWSYFLLLPPAILRRLELFRSFIWNYLDQFGDFWTYLDLFEPLYTFPSFPFIPTLAKCPSFLTFPVWSAQGHPKTYHNYGSDTLNQPLIQALPAWPPPIGV